MSNFPSGSDIFVARFETGLTWSEMRAHFKVSARSSRFLAECVAYVQSDQALLEKHPEFAPIDGDAAMDVDHAEYRATRDFIRAERLRGVGLALLTERSGLKSAQLKKIVGEADVVGTTTRVAWGARYGGRKVVEEATEEAPEADEAPEAPVVEEATPVAEEAPEEAPVKATPVRRRRNRKAVEETAGA
jgi:lambda repressor-like predicted transcriptional regulator